MQKADPQSRSHRAPDRIVPDETVVRIDDERHWRYAAVDPQTNGFPHIRLFLTGYVRLAVPFLRERRDERRAEQTTFSVDGATVSKPHCHDSVPDCR